MPRTRLVVVHPRPSALASLASMLQNIRYEIVEASGDRAAVRLLARSPGLVLIGVDPGEPERRPWTWSLTSGGSIPAPRSSCCSRPGIPILRRKPFGWGRSPS
jgi:hypothetical protein